MVQTTLVFYQLYSSLSHLLNYACVLLLVLPAVICRAHGRPL